MGYHVHHVSKSFNQRIVEFRSYLLIKKLFGLDIKLDFGFMHEYFKIMVFQSFAHAWKGVAALRKFIERFNIKESIFEKLRSIGFFLWLIFTFALSFIVMLFLLL